jgi:hypothetical protein
VTDALDVKETSVGRKADLAQFGKIFDASADAKIASVVDGRFGSTRLQQLVVLLDTRLFVVDMPRRHDAVCNDAGTEPTWRAAVDLAIEYQADLARPANVQVLADHFFEEDATRNRLIEHLSERELRRAGSDSPRHNPVPETDAVIASATCAAADRSFPQSSHRPAAAAA